MAMIVMRPIRSIGRIYSRLPEAVQKEARAVAKYGGNLPSWRLQELYLRYERIARYANYV